MHPYTSEKKNLTSGGLEGARYGACFMVGGSAEGIKIAEHILKTLAVNEDGYVCTGNLVVDIL